jgi:hypothetical protein
MAHRKGVVMQIKMYPPKDTEIDGKYLEPINVNLTWRMECKIHQSHLTHKTVVNFILLYSYIKGNYLCKISSAI